MSDLEALKIVRAVERAPSFQKVYGKRIIVIGGGAQVVRWWSARSLRPIGTTSAASGSR
jgi:uncharacterized protein with ACT and thioredoxin-like domain